MIIHTINPKNFPSRLTQIPSPPKRLFLRGEMPNDEMKFLSVVGSRKYSEYGKMACEKLIEGLRGLPIVIISGLAIGIDKIAHKSALRAGLKTIAVPGSGIDDKTIYPAMSRELAKEILENGGALLSEFEPNQKAAPWTFPQRNRIMAGLSDAVLIVEAEMKSGTLITARLALDYNRDVLAVPGSIFSPNTEGIHFLLKNGATPIRDSEDILKALHFEIDILKDKNAILQNCSEEEKEIINLLGDGISRDELANISGKSLSEINAILSMLEIKGIIKESMGEIVLG